MWNHMVLLRACFVAAAAAASVAGCGGGGVNTTPVAANPSPTATVSGGPSPTPTAHASGTPTSTPAPTPTPTVAPTPLYLYVATTQHIALLPATATAVAASASVLVPSANTSGIAVNATFVATCIGSAINVYTKPLTAGSVPAFHFSPVTSNQEGGSTFNYTTCNGDVAFDGSGNLYAIVTGSGYGSHGVVLKFAAPLSGATSTSIVADLTISNNIVRGMLAFDPSNNLYLNSQLGLEQWTPPNYVQPEATVFNSGNTGIGAAFDANGNAYFANLSTVAFVPAPLTGASTPSYAITLPAVAFGVALSPAGLLVAIDGGGSMHVFAPPLSGASTGTASTPFTGGETANQITFGN
jgi:hypothetical protein